jgi:hypothetical protein
VATVSIAWFRDLVICIWGLGATVAVIVILVLAIMLYLKIRPIVNSAKTVAKSVENISTCVEQEVVGPLAQVVAFVQGCRKAINVISQFGKKKEE